MLLGDVIGIDEDGTAYGLVFSGLESEYKDIGLVYDHGPSRHLTIVFNVFVWL